MESLPDGSRIHDPWHHYASLLIAAGLDIETVQARLPHTSASTILNVYGQMWPDKTSPHERPFRSFLLTV